MREWLKKDSFYLGLILGLIMPVAMFFVIRGALHLLDSIVSPITLKFHYVLLISTTVNLFTLRYYLVNLKNDKTGRGILAITFVYVILYFVFFHQ